MKSNILPRLIFVEGVDRVGKTTLIEAIHKATDYKHIIVDRGVISNMVYSISKKRYSKRNMEKYNEIDSSLGRMNALVIYVTCDTDIIQKRIELTNHEYVDVDFEKELFEDFVSTTEMCMVKVDTGKNTTDEIVEKLLSIKMI